MPPFDMDDHYVGDEDITGGLECIVPCKSLIYYTKKCLLCRALQDVGHGLSLSESSPCMALGLYNQFHSIALLK